MAAGVGEAWAAGRLGNPAVARSGFPVSAVREDLPERAAAAVSHDDSATPPFRFCRNGDIIGEPILDLNKGPAALSGRQLKALLAVNFWRALLTTKADIIP